MPNSLVSLSFRHVDNLGKQAVIMKLNRLSKPSMTIAKQE